jgi:S1-C subfamily serine protease
VSPGRKMLAPRGSVLAAVAILLAPGRTTCGQDCKKVVASQRRAVVYLRVEKTVAASGAVELEFGTGFIVSGRGYVLTADHVVYRNERFVDVKIQGGVASSKAPLVDLIVIREDTPQDLALLMFADTGHTYDTVSLGDPGSVAIGTHLCSMGFPLNVEFHLSDGRLGGVGGRYGWWTTDMPSNRGESGAPVFDDTDRAIAIKVGGLDEAQNINYLIPMSYANPLLGIIPSPGAPRIILRTTGASAPIPTSRLVKLAGAFNVEAKGCEVQAATFSALAPGRLDTSKGGADPAPPGFEFRSAGNGSHGMRNMSLNGGSLAFTLWANGGGTKISLPFQGETCLAPTGSNSALEIYAWVFEQ